MANNNEEKKQKVTGEKLLKRQVMMTVTGRKVNTYVELAVRQMELEAQYLISQMELEVQSLLLDGVTERQAVSRVMGILNNEEDFVKVWMNRNKRIIDTLHANMVAVPVKEYGMKHPKKKFIWSLDAGAKHCGDCEALSGFEPQTIKEWMDEGYDLPRQGGTQCSYGCRCMLVAVE